MNSKNHLNWKELVLLPSYKKTLKLFKSLETLELGNILGPPSDRIK